MKTISEINSAILGGGFSTDELQSINDAVTFARAQLGRSVKRELRNGTKVSFYHSKRGVTYTGAVDKVAQKYVYVKVADAVRGAVRWKVPASLLTVVA